MEKVNKLLLRVRLKMEQLNKEQLKEENISQELKTTTNNINIGLKDIFNHIDNQNNYIKKLEEEISIIKTKKEESSLEEVKEDRDRILKELFYLRKNNIKDFDISNIEEMKEEISTLEIKLSLSNERVEQLLKDKERCIKNLRLIENKTAKVMKRLVNLIKNT